MRPTLSQRLQFKGLYRVNRNGKTDEAVWQAEQHGRGNVVWGTRLHDWYRRSLERYERLDRGIGDWQPLQCADITLVTWYSTECLDRLRMRDIRSDGLCLDAFNAARKSVIRHSPVLNGSH